MMFDFILQGFSTQSPLAGAAGSLSGPRRRWRRRSVRGLGGAAVVDPSVATAALAPPDPSGGLGGADAAIAVSGHGGAAVTDHDREPRGGGYLYLRIEGYLAGTLAACQLGVKPYGTSI
jgi:hypothetical protein